MKGISNSNKCIGASHLVLRDENALVNHFDGIKFAAIFFLCKQHHPKATGTEEPVKVKLIDSHNLSCIAKVENINRQASANRSSRRARAGMRLRTLDERCRAVGSEESQGGAVCRM